MLQTVHQPQARDRQAGESRISLHLGSRGVRILAAAVIASVLFVGWLGRLDGALPEFIASVANTLGCVVVAVLTAVAARRSMGNQRKAWYAIALAFAAWAVGEGYWTYELAIGLENPYPNPGDIFFTIGYVGLTAGAGLLASPFEIFKRRRIVFGGAAVALTVAALVWAFVLQDPYSEIDESPLFKIAVIGYAVADGVIIAALVSAWMDLRKERSGGVFGLFLLGMLGILAADIQFVFLAFNDSASTVLMNIGWYGGYVACAAGAARYLQIRDNFVTAATNKVSGLIRLWHAELGVPILLSVALAFPDKIDAAYIWMALGAAAFTLLRGLAVTRQSIQINRALQDVSARLERRQDVILDANPDPVGIARHDRIIYANPALVRLMDGVYPSTVADIGHTDDLALAGARLREIARTQSSEFHEFRLRNDGDGPDRWIMAATHYIPALDGDQHMVIVGREVTERRAQEQKLRESEAHKAAILDHAPDAILTFDRGGKVLSWNRSGVVMFGFGTDVAPEGLSDLLRPADGTSCEVKFGQVMGDIQNSPLVECQAMRQDGTEIPVEVGFGRISDDEYIAFIHDVSSRKSAEAALLHAQKMEAVGTLAGGVAHDFNNLLTAITGYAEFLAFSFEEGDERKSDINEVLGAARRASALTRQLLAFARKQPVDVTHADANEVIANLEKMLQRLIGPEIELVSTTCAEPAGILIDVGQLEQILVNLAVNARDALPSGGTIRMATNIRQLTAESVPGLPAGEYVEIAVTDTGTGIPPEILAQIFEPFFTTKGIGKGTGLGLSTCYGIAQQAGGTITVESRLRWGTTFRVFLPRIEADHADNETANTTVDTEFAARVLLVDDELSVRKVLARSLEQDGFDVTEADNGSFAIQLVRSATVPFDAVVTDLLMPGGASGRDVAAEVRDCMPGCRVLLISGYDPEGESDATLPLLPKPFAPHELTHRLRELLATSA